MTFKVADLTKNSKWKLTAEVPFYEIEHNNYYGINQLKKFTYNAPVGTEFTVPIKRLSGTFNDQGWDRVKREPIAATWEASGVYYTLELNGKLGAIFFSDIKNCIELVEQPKDIAIVIKDTVSGTYYVDLLSYCTQYDQNKIKQAEAKLKAADISLHYNRKSYNQYLQEVHDAAIGVAPDLKKSEVALTFGGVEFKFASSPLSGKVFKNIGFAKQRLLMTVGYYNGTDNDMMKTSSPISEIPDSWVLVEYDRVSKTETVLDFDLKEYVNHALELKVLTTKYGSSTRSMYQKLEKKGELDKYKHFLIFTPGNVDQQPLSEYMKNKYDNPLLEEVDRYSVKEIYDGGSYTIKKTEVKMVKDILDKKMKKVFGDDSICIAIENRRDAMEIQFTYLGNLNFKLIDMVTLQEIVQEDEVQS